MSEYIIQVITPWIGTGTSVDQNRPAIVDSYQGELGAWSDITSGVPNPDPNLYVLRVPVTQAGFDAIDADSDYQILSSEVIEDE